MEILKKINVNEVLRKGYVENEFEYKKLQNHLRLLESIIEENENEKHLIEKARKIAEMLGDYGKKQRKEMDFFNPPEEWLKEEEQAAREAEEEWEWIKKRKAILKQKLKEYNLKQQELGYLLGYKSKSHISRVFNGIKPLKLKDAYIVSKLLKIDIKLLTDNRVNKDVIQRIEYLQAKNKNPKRFEKLKKELL